MRDEVRTAAGAHGALLASLDALGEERGAFEPLGPRHAALFVDESPDALLVTCERLEAVAARDDALPLGLGLADRRGWSSLCLLAEGETGWRDATVWRYLDRLVDDGFFEDFDRVVFYGAGLAGYAAAAFSVAAPGATVLALAPRATLEPARAGWDNRHPALRRADFRSRYGYAPEMVEAAGLVVLAHDPWVTRDAMHAALFTGAHVVSHALRGLGPDPEARLSEMGLLVPLIEAACEGSLTPATLPRLWRARRSNLAWLRLLARRAEVEGHPDRARRICRSALSRLDAPQFRAKLAELERAAPGAARMRAL